MGIALQAEDFLLSQPAAVGGARFWTLEGYGIRAGAKLFNDDLEYYVFSSVSGKPGAALAHGHANVVSRVDQGLHNGLGGTLRTFEYTFAFESPSTPPRRRLWARRRH